MFFYIIYLLFFFKKKGEYILKIIFIIPKVIKKIIFLIGSHIEKLNYIFIKTEPECLNGLINQYKKVDYISIDAEFERGINQESTIVECINIMNRKNFKLIDFNPKRFCILFKNNN